MPDSHFLSSLKLFAGRCFSWNCSDFLKRRIFDLAEQQSYMKRQCCTCSCSLQDIRAQSPAERKDLFVHGALEGNAGRAAAIWKVIMYQSSCFGGFIATHLRSQRSLWRRTVQPLFVNTLSSFVSFFSSWIHVPDLTVVLWIIPWIVGHTGVCF